MDFDCQQLRIGVVSKFVLPYVVLRTHRSRGTRGVSVEYASGRALLSFASGWRAHLQSLRAHILELEYFLLQVLL